MTSLSWLFSDNANSAINYIGFDDMKTVIRSTKYIIINTLLENEQSCLILSTIPASEETATINNLIENYETRKKTIIIYGKHGCDPTVLVKRKQLASFGFSSIYIYYGGIFEWLLLQDIYGIDQFPTTSRVLDILKYRPLPVLNS
jgi:hypothetical protein